MTKVIDKEFLEKKKHDLEQEIAALHNAQLSLKTLINAEYGALANKYFRYYDVNLASAITLSGQLAIRWIENYLMNHPLQKKYKWDVIYSDTDSAYLSIEHFVNVIKKKHPDIKINNLLDLIDSFTKKVLQPIINEGYDELAKYMNANENCMIMKREKVCETGIWTGKKKYALLVWDDEGVRFSDTQLKVKGFEIVKSSTPKIIRDKLKEGMKLILTDKEKLPDFVSKTRKEFYSYDPEEIAFPRGVTKLKKIDDYGRDEWEYKGMPIHIRAARAYNDYITKNDLISQYPLIRKGEKIKFLYMKMPNPGLENVFAFLKRMPEEMKQYVDYKKQYQKSFLAFFENIEKNCLTVIRFKNEVIINDLF